MLNVTAATLFRLCLPHWCQAAGGWQDLCQRCVDIVLVAADVSLELVIIKLKMKQSSYVDDSGNHEEGLCYSHTERTQT